ncbi:MAG: hypothetical protein R2796_12130 [Chitinophagaceae bacterium]
MSIDNPPVQGIVYMLLAAFGIFHYGRCCKIAKGSFGAGQLAIANAIGLLLLLVSFKVQTCSKSGWKTGLTHFPGLETLALYALLYCILHIPLGTAMTYNLSSALFIAIFSFLYSKNTMGVSFCLRYC